MPNATDLARTITRPRRRSIQDGTLIGEFFQGQADLRSLRPDAAGSLIYAFWRLRIITSSISASMSAVCRGRWSGDILALLRWGRRTIWGSHHQQRRLTRAFSEQRVTVGRKLKETVLATRLGKSSPNSRSMELYLNEIWLGYRSYGVGATAIVTSENRFPTLTSPIRAYLAALPRGRTTTSRSDKRRPRFVAAT